MNQTPIHDNHNPDLLRLIPASAKKIIEIGCSSGALAREFKKINPRCQYLGIDIDSSYIQFAKIHCDEVLAINIEDATDDFFEINRSRDCWVFGDTLEHFKNPWKILEKIRAVIPEHGYVVACIPNAQHWSVQVKLAIGDFRYEDSGLFDRTHLRWFTRQTMIEMFANSGFKISTGFPRIFDEPSREYFLPLIGELAKAAGVAPETAISDAMPLQYVIRAVPI